MTCLSYIVSITNPLCPKTVQKVSCVFVYIAIFPGKGHLIRLTKPAEKINTSQYRY